jgi:hypothetical protein
VLPCSQLCGSLTLSCLVLSCLVLSCLVLSCLVLSCHCINIMIDSTSSDPALQEWSKFQEKKETLEMKTQLDKLTQGPKKGFIHRMFNFISFWMGIAGFLMIIGQVIGLQYYEVDPIQAVMRCYVVLMCLLVIVNELQWFQFIRESAILRIWITRGIFYSFVGVLGMEENDTTAVATVPYTGQAQALKFVEVVAYMMVACGMVYFVMGCLCIQLIYNRAVADYEERCNETMANRKRTGKSTSTSEGSIV